MPDRPKEGHSAITSACLLCHFSDYIILYSHQYNIPRKCGRSTEASHESIDICESQFANCCGLELMHIRIGLTSSQMEAVSQCSDTQLGLCPQRIARVGVSGLCFGSTVYVCVNVLTCFVCCVHSQSTPFSQPPPLLPYRVVYQILRNFPLLDYAVVYIVNYEIMCTLSLYTVTSSVMFVCIKQPHSSY